MRLPPDPEQLRILSVLLAMPEADALDALRDFQDQIPWLEPCLPELEKLSVEQWQAEHTRLFVNGYPKTACPPYESAYRQGTMGGTSTRDLAALYSRAGLVAKDVVPDYLGTMLEFAAYLLDQGMEDLFAELLDDHMRVWLARFARDLKEQAGLGLYRELGTRIGLLFAVPEDGDIE